MLRIAWSFLCSNARGAGKRLHQRGLYYFAKSHPGEEGDAQSSDALFDGESIVSNVKDVFIPEGKIEKRFSRSSGPGGQNVNKVNSKAEIRFNVYEADWLSSRAKRNILQKYSNSVNKEGEFII